MSNGDLNVFNVYNNPRHICKLNLCLLWQLIRKIFFQDKNINSEEAEAQYIKVFGNKKRKKKKLAYLDKRHKPRWVTIQPNMIQSQPFLGVPVCWAR